MDQRVSFTPARAEVVAAVKGWTWQPRAPLSIARMAATGAVVGQKIYVIGGIDSRCRTLRSLEIYDPATDRWETGPPLPVERHHAAATMRGSMLYVIGGYQGMNFVPKPEIFVLNTLTHQWNRDSDLPEGRGGHLAVCMMGDIYVIGGRTAAGVSRDLLYLHVADRRWERVGDVEREWDHLTPLSVGRDKMAGGAMGSRIVVAGGQSEHPPLYHNQLEMIDVAVQRWQHAADFYRLPASWRHWTVGPPLPTARSGAASTTIDDLLIVSGGQNDHGTVRQVEAYDFHNHTWLTFPHLQQARHGAVSAAVGDMVYVIGGSPKPGVSTCSSVERLSLSG